MPPVHADEVDSAIARDTCRRTQRVGEEGAELHLAHLTRGHHELAVLSARSYRASPNIDRISPDPHIVGRIKESRIDTRPVADDPLQKSGIAAVATSNPVLAQNPDIAWLRPWRYREGRDDLIIGIGGRRENDVDLASREAGQRGIDIDIDRSEFAQFQLQDFQIPAGIESNLVVGDPERPLLDLGEAGQGDSRDLSKPHRPGGLKPAMARDDMALGVSQYRIGEAERFNG